MSKAPFASATRRWGSAQIVASGALLFPDLEGGAEVERDRFELFPTFRAQFSEEPVESLGGLPDPTHTIFDVWRFETEGEF